MSIRDWLDERTGYRSALAAVVSEPVPGGARWSYVGGSVLVILAVVQAVTGVVLAMHYAPSAETAWASVAFIQDTLPCGWFVRGLHSACASAMVLVCTLHLIQVALWGAYRAPRELNWIAGVLLLVIVLAFALTGYLLPWDQKGYWATRVATGIVGSVPLVGEALERALVGGDHYGSYTLTRFFSLHVLVLPALLLTLIGIHVKLFRRHHVTPSWRLTQEQLTVRRQAFWPDQVFRDAVAAAVTVGAAAAVTWYRHGAELEAPADPGSVYVARPEWYFRPLFQLLRVVDGRFEVLAAVGLPFLVLALLLALPFLDRAKSRAPRRRLSVLVPLAGLLAASVLLGWTSFRDDASSPELARQRAEAGEKAELARSLAREGVPPPGGTAVYRNDPWHRERALWESQCQPCHSLTGLGGPSAPDLRGYMSRAWIERYFRDPGNPLNMGPAQLDKGMKPVRATDDELRALVELTYQETGAADAAPALVERGRALFSAKDCDACHDLDGTSESSGPNLGRWGTPARIADVIRNPGAEVNYGKRATMRSFAGVLTDEQMSGLARFLVEQRRQSVTARSK